MYLNVRLYASYAVYYTAFEGTQNAHNAKKKSCFSLRKLVLSQLV